MNGQGLVGEEIGRSYYCGFPQRTRPGGKQVQGLDLGLNNSSVSEE